MPVIVPRDKYDLWLDPDVNDFEAIRDILKTLRRKLDAPLSGQHETQQFKN